MGPAVSSLQKLRGINFQHVLVQPLHDFTVAGVFLHGFAKSPHAVTQKLQRRSHVCLNLIAPEIAEKANRFG